MDELRTALELATEEELQGLTEILFRRRFNPFDYLQGLDPVEVQNQERKIWLDALEQRFRFLAADGFTVLKRQTGRVTYRQVLIQVCRHLKLSYSTSLSTTDLEAEIFLNLLNRVWRKLPASERKILTRRIQHSLAEASPSQSLPIELHREPLRLLLEGGSALAISSFVRPMLLQQVAGEFAAHFAAYQMAVEAATVPLQLESQIAMQTARRGMALSATRYGATRSIFAVMGSALWVWFLADLGWRAIATNHGRVIPTVFALAQIRLTRSECFNPA
jgi:uncharacterized protein YaaW (UPF0174 family)